MTIVLSGSGSGGHITPLLAVAKEIKKLDNTARLVYIGEKGGKFQNIIQKNKDLFEETHYIYTGKFRRYHNESFLIRITDFKTNALNLRDSIKITVGTIQAIFLLRKIKASKVFLKGGSVCLSAGLGARLAGVTTITHDSDALPGISNRIGGRHAKYHTTAMPPKYYRYHQDKVIQVGLPIDEKFKQVSLAEKDKLRRKHSIPKDAEVLLITGGSNGARRLNSWCNQVLPEMIKDNLSLYVIFVVGKGNVSEIDDILKFSDRVKLIEFSDEMNELSLVSDVVVARAGATTIAEFAYSAKPLILVPNPDLTGGHQVKNAKVYKDLESAIVLSERELEKDPSIIAKNINKILKNKDFATKIGRNLQKTLPEVPASESIAKLLLDK